MIWMAIYNKELATRNWQIGQILTEGQQNQHQFLEQFKGFCIMSMLGSLVSF